MSSKNKNVFFYTGGYTGGLTKITADFIIEHVEKPLDKLARQLGQLSSLRPNPHVDAAKIMVNKTSDIISQTITVKPAEQTMHNESDAPESIPFTAKP